MNHNSPATTRASAMAMFRRQRLSRREALSLMTKASLAASGAIILPSSAFVSMAQDGSMPATPALGEQSDGTVTWHVLTGHMDAERGIVAMAFLPNEITINVGDRIFFDVHDVHTVTYLGGMEQPPVFVPERDVSGTPSAAMGGDNRFVGNPVAAFPAGPPVHDGTSYMNLGLPDPTTPFVAEFTAPGTFEFICLVHPVDMKLTIVVQEQGAERPMDQAGYDQLATEQMDEHVERGLSLIEQHTPVASATPADGAAIWDVVVGVGAEGTQVMLFLPDRLEISAGDTVRWTNLGVVEPHTVTFLGGSEPPEVILVEPQPEGPPTLVLNPDVVNPAGEPTYDGTSYANSGWLQEDPVEFAAGTEFPHSWELTFDQPGEYPYYCVLHGGPSPEGDQELVGMVGTIVVS